MLLLKEWGDPKRWPDVNEEDAENYANYYNPKPTKNNQLVLAEGADAGNVSAIEGNRDSLELVPYDPKANMSRGSKRGKNGALVPYSRKLPRNKIARKAMLEIEAIKKKRDEKKKVVEPSKKKFKSFFKDFDSNKIIYKEGLIDKMKSNKHGLPEIELFEYEDEEKHDADAMKLFMKKYSKLWKFYFRKYSND
jgi:hypothetical protein